MALNRFRASFKELEPIVTADHLKLYFEDFADTANIMSAIYQWKIEDTSNWSLIMHRFNSFMFYGLNRYKAKKHFMLALTEFNDGEKYETIFYP